MKKVIGLFLIGKLEVLLEIKYSAMNSHSDDIELNWLFNEYY